MKQIQATGEAFAVILEDGFVATWGRADHGGDSSQILSRVSTAIQENDEMDLAPLRFFHFSVFLYCCRHAGQEMDSSLHGVMQTLAVTVRQFKISSRVCSKFKPQNRPRKLVNGYQMGYFTYNGIYWGYNPPTY